MPRDAWGKANARAKYGPAKSSQDSGPSLDMQLKIAERFRQDTLQRIEAESVVAGDAEGI